MHDIETGIANALQRHITRHVVPPPQISQKRLDFEQRRPMWIREMVAEALEVFIFVCAGISAVASFILNGTNSAFGSIFQIGCSLGVGIAFAILICAPVSGGHFNPAITICFALWKGFPWRKVPQYIFAQVFGSFLAGLFVVGQYRQQIWDLKAKLIAEGVTSFNFNGGPGSILCSFPNADQTNLGYLFMTEFFISSFISLVIWATLDAANPFVSPTGAPFVIGMAFSVMIWGFADITISANMARDLGTRIVAAIFFGGDAFTYRHYSWIGILTTIPASVFGTSLYELVMKDSIANIAKGLATHSDGKDGLARHFSLLDTLENN
ncbi:aquaporin-like protein [Xylogone sp. PMI_703]|nr:aquaporin-like protein [Xylogone sp. PMI_703]